MEIFGKKIDGTVLLVIALIFVALAFVIFTFTSNFIQKGTNQAAAQQAFLDNSIYETYSNKMVKGDTVVDCIRRAEKAFPSKIQVNVTNGVGTQNYGYVGNVAPYVAYAVTDPLNNNYINPSKTFLATITKNNNDTVTTITFVQQ